MESLLNWSLNRDRKRGEQAAGDRYQAMANAGALNAQYTAPPPPPPTSFLSNLFGRGGRPAAPSAPAPRLNSGQPTGSYWEQALAARGTPMVPTTKGRMTADYLKRAREVLSKTVPYAMLTGNNPQVLARTTVQAAAGQEVAPQQAGAARNAYLGTQSLASGATFGLVQQDEGQTPLERGIQTVGSFVGAALPWEAAFRYVGAPAAVAATPVGEAAGNAAARLAARLGAREGVQQGTKALTGFFAREAARGAAAATAATLPTLLTEPAKTPLEAVKRVGGAVLNSVGLSVGLPLVGEAVSRFGARPIARVIGDRLRTFVPTGEAVAGSEADLASAGYRFLKGRDNVPGLWVKQEPTTGLHYGVRVERRVSPEGNVQTWFQTFQEAPKGAKAAPQAAEAGRPVIDVTAQPARGPAAAQTATAEPAPGPSPNVPAQPEPGQTTILPVAAPDVPSATATVTNENPITFAGYIRGGAKKSAPDLVKEADRRNKAILKETGKPGSFQVMLATAKDGQKLYVISSSGEAGAVPAANWRELSQTGSGYDHLYVPETGVGATSTSAGAAPAAQTAAGTPPAASDQAKREPWQMTRAEYEGAATPAPSHFAGTKYPETVYHGSGADNIEQFFTGGKDLAGNTGAKTARLGAFFSEDPTIASMAAYGFNVGGAFDTERKLTLYEAHVNMKNPLEVNNLTEKQVGELDRRMPGFRASFEKAKAKGEMFGVVQFLSRVREPKPEVGNFSEWAAQHGIPEADVDRLWKENAPAFQEWRRAFDEYSASATEPAASRALQEMGYDGIVVKTLVDSGPALGAKKQYIVFKPENIAISRKYPAVEHRQWVEWAIQNGKTIPPEVLKDYPDPKSAAAQTAQLSSEPGGPSAGTAAPLTTTETPDVSRPSAQEQGGGSVSPSAAPERFQAGEQVRVKGLSGTYTAVADEGKKTVKLQAEGGDTLVPRGRTLFPARNSVERVGGAAEAAAAAEGSGGVQAFAGARPERSVPEGQAPMKPMQRKALIAWLGKQFDVTMAKGHFNQKALGIYKVKPEVIRTRAWGDLETLAHEIGHHVDKQLGLDRLGNDAELLKLGGEATNKTDPTAVRKEGVAEFFRLYLGDPAEAQRQAPGYYAAFEKRLESESDIAKTIAEAQDQFRAFFAGSARDRVDAAISWNNRKVPLGDRFGAVPEAVGRAWNRIVDNWFDSNAAVLRAQRRIAGRQELSADQDAYLRMGLLSRTVAGRGEAKLRQLGETLSPVGKDAGDYFRYADARRVVHLADTFGYGDEKLPFSKADAQVIIRQAEASPQADQFRATFDREQEFYHNLLVSELKAGGVLNDEQIAQIEAKHQAYIPFYRDVSGRRAGTGGGRTTVNLPKAVMRQHGGSEPLLDPMERRVRYVTRLVGIAERNKVGVALANFLRSFEGTGSIMDEVPPPMREVTVKAGDIMSQLEKAGVDTADLDPLDTMSFFRPEWAKGKGDSIVTVYEGGKPRYYDVHDAEVLRAIANVDPVTANLAAKLTGMVRVGYTITPSFSIANLVRDTFESFALSKHQVVPGQALFEAMRLAATKDPFIGRVIEGGLKQGGWLRPERQSAQMFEQIAKGKRVNLTPRGLWNIYQQVREQPEFWTRLGEAHLEYKARLKAGAPEEEAFLRAVAEGGRITLDFTRGGYTAKQINRYVPFFKIPFEAAYRVGEAATEHPGVFLLKLLPFVAWGVATAVLNHDNKQYDEASDYERDRYMLLPWEKALVRVPKANGVFAIIQNTAERAMRQWKADDPHAWDNFAKDALNELTPRLSNPVLELIVAAATGQSLDSDFPILTESDKNLPPEMQYDSNTSLLARGIAKVGVLGKSPKMAQHDIETVIPGYSQGLFGLENFLRRLTGAGGGKPAAARPEDWPVVGRFISRPGEGKQGRSISVFYDEKDAADKAYAGLKRTVEQAAGWPEGASYTVTDTGVKAKGKFTPAQFKALQAELTHLRKDDPDQFKLITRRSTYNKVAGMLSDLRAKRKEAEESKTLSPDAKRRAIEGFNLQMTNLVRKAYGKDLMND